MESKHNLNFYGWDKSDEGLNLAFGKQACGCQPILDPNPWPEGVRLSG